MSGGYKQANEIGQLTTPLGPDKLLLTRFDGTEGLSELFEFHVEALHQDRKVDFDSALGQDCKVSLKTTKGDKRHFVGTLVEVRAKGEMPSGFLHELVLRPWLWLLSQRINSRIFHDKTAVDIIKDIIDKAGESARLDDRCKKTHPQIEYCVQHNESDLDFICRLMETHGIHYRYDFSSEKQMLVLGDDPSAHEDISGSTRNFYGDATYLARKEEEHFYSWTPSRHFTTGKVMLNDYDIMQPAQNLKADKSPEPSVKYSPGQLEDYTHPYPQALNKSITRDEGTKYAEVRIGAYRATDQLFTGLGDTLSAAPGLKVTLAKTPEGKYDAQYLITRISHSFGQQQYRSGGGDAGVVYQAVVTAMPVDVPFIPPAVTPKPYIAGPQTAKVVARPQQQGQEIDCDELGRIFVHFHWTRESESELEGQSMACRVAQVWAGAGWGGMFIPRVGMEVLVQFIDGDPDRPIVIGTVYNGQGKSKNFPPYDLPGKKNIAGWKSKSTMQGGSDNYNELYMDDTKGSELVNFQAEKDLTSLIKHDETRTIKNDRTTKIGEPKQVGNDKLDVGLNRTTEIGVDESLKVGNTMTVEAITSITLKVGGSSIEITPTSITVKTTDLSTNGSASASHTAGGSMTISGATVAIN